MKKLTKIIYFDEPTALDYVEIKDKGHYVKAILNDGVTKGLAKAGAGASTPSFLSSILSVEGKVAVSTEGSQIVRNYVTNTVLTDFIQKAEKDSSIIELDDYKLTLTEETRLHILTAITNASNGNIPMDESAKMGIDVSKLGSILLNIRGYLECFASKDSEKIVLRFNHAAFRNQYQLADALQMNLSYYAVRVGNSSTSSLMALGLDLTNKSQTVQDRLVDITSGNGQADTKETHDIYDVILAGVFHAK